MANDNIFILAAVGAFLYLYSKMGSPGQKPFVKDITEGVVSGGSAGLGDVLKGVFDAGANAGENANKFIFDQENQLGTWLKSWYPTPAQTAPFVENTRTTYLNRAPSNAVGSPVGSFAPKGTFDPLHPTQRSVFEGSQSSKVPVTGGGSTGKGSTFLFPGQNLKNFKRAGEK